MGIHRAEASGFSHVVCCASTEYEGQVLRVFSRDPLRDGICLSCTADPRTHFIRHAKRQCHIFVTRRDGHLHRGLEIDLCWSVIKTASELKT